MKIASGAQLALFNENRERRSTRAHEKTSGARERRSLSAARNFHWRARVERRSNFELEKIILQQDSANLITFLERKWPNTFENDKNGKIFG